MLLPMTKGRKLASGLLKNGPPRIHASMKRWIENRDVVAPIFKFSQDVRKIIYTTNAIESLNSSYRKQEAPAQCVPKRPTLLKVLYLATFEATKKWTQPIHNWGQAYGQMCIMYGSRLPIYRKRQLHSKKSVCSI